MTARWQTVRVFISSTFRDMQAERDHLVRFVFPKLRESLIDRRINLVDVDLRWGVTSDQDALEVCREIIDDCRPRFLCLLGGRYGWTPPDRSTSITEDEVRYAVLDRSSDRTLAFFYFRDPATTADIVEPEPGQYREPPDSEDAARLDALKRAIREHGFDPFVYPARWDGAAARLVALEALGERVFADVLGSIEAEFGAATAEAVDNFAVELAVAESQEQGLLEHFEPGQRADLLNRLVAFANGKGGAQLLLLTGPAGSGKSTLLAACRRKLADEMPTGCLLVFHAVGATPGSSTVSQMLARLCRDLASSASADAKLPDDEGGLVHAFADRLIQAARVGRVVMVLDGVDELDPADVVRSASWLPRTLPPGVRILASCADERVAAAMRRRQSAAIEPVPPFAREDAAALTVRFLGRYGKRLSADQMQDFLAKDGTTSPLFVVAALDEIRTLGRYEEITDRLRQLPPRADELFGWILQRLAEEPSLHEPRDVAGDEQLVRRTAQFLASARKGLTAADLAALVVPGDPRGHLAALLRLLRPYLSTRGELIEFRHSLFREAARLAYSATEDVVVAAHSRLGEHFLREADAASDRTWAGRHPCALGELPFQLTGGRSWDTLYGVMTDFGYLERRVAAEPSVVRDYGTLHVVPRFGSPITLRCEACGWSDVLDTSTIAASRRASIGCVRCRAVLRIAQLIGIGPVEPIHAHTVVCGRCEAATMLPRAWFEGGLRFARVVCGSCAEETTIDVRRRATLHYAGGIGLQDDFQRVLESWPAADVPPEQRQTLERVQHAFRATSFAWQASPSLLFPQVHPLLYATSGAASAECRAIGDRYAGRFSSRGPWLRAYLGSAASSTEAIAFAATSAITAMCMAGARGPLIVGTSDGRLLVADPDTGRIQTVACGSRRLLAVGQARLDGRPGVVIVAEGGDVFTLDVDNLEVRRLGRAGAAGAADVCPDGRLLATGSQWGEIVLWNAESRTRLASVMPRRSAIARLCFSGSGGALLVGFASGLTTLHETRSLGQIGVISPQGTRGSFAPAPPDDAWWFVGDDGRVLRCTRDGRTETTPSAAGGARMTAASVTPLGELAAVGTADGTVKVFPGRPGLEREFRIAGRVMALLLSDDLSLVAAADDTGRCRVWHLAGGGDSAGVGSVEAASGPAWAGGALAVGSRAGACALFTADGIPIGTIESAFPFSGPASAAFAAPIVVAGAGSGWKAWDVTARSAQGVAQLAGTLTSLAVSPHGDIVCTGNAAGVIAAWDARTGAERGRREVGGKVAGIAFAPDGERIFSADRGARVIAWQLRAAEADLPGARRLLVTGDGDDDSGYLAPIQFSVSWEVQLGVEPASIDAARDGSRVAIGSEEGIIILDAENGRRIGESESTDGTWSTVSFAPRGGLLFGLSSQGAVHVWDLDDDGRLLCRYELLAEPVGGTWLSDGWRFSVTDSGGRLLWFDVTGYQPRRTIDRPAPAVRRLRRFLQPVRP